MARTSVIFPLLFFLSFLGRDRKGNLASTQFINQIIHKLEKYSSNEHKITVPVSDRMKCGDYKLLNIIHCRYNQMRQNENKSRNCEEIKQNCATAEIWRSSLSDSNEISFSFLNFVFKDQDVFSTIKLPEIKL